MAKGLLSDSTAKSLRLTEWYYTMGCTCTSLYGAQTTENLLHAELKVMVWYKVWREGIFKLYGRISPGSQEQSSYKISTILHAMPAPGGGLSSSVAIGVRVDVEEI